MNTDRIVIADLIYNQRKTGTFVFLRIKGDRFVLLDDVKSELELNRFNINKLNIFDASKDCCCYIDKETIKPFYCKTEHKSLKKIKLDYLLDPRNPRGVKY